MTTQPFTRCPMCRKKGVQFRFAKVVPGEDGYGCRYCDFWFFTGSNDRMDVENRTWWEWANPNPTVDPQWRHDTWASVEEFAFNVGHGDDWECFTCGEGFWRKDAPGWEEADEFEQRRLGAENYLRAHHHRMGHKTGGLEQR